MRKRARPWTGRKELGVVGGGRGLGGVGRGRGVRARSGLVREGDGCTWRR